MKQRFFYKIDGFYPPDPNELRMGQWGFSIHLSKEFAKLCVDHKITKDNNFQLIAREMIDNLGLGTLFTRYMFYKDTLLLLFYSVVGNACDLGIDGSKLQAFINQKDFKNFNWLSYHPHNVDSQTQAHGLLALWLEWYAIAEAILELNQTF